MYFANEKNGMLMYFDVLGSGIKFFLLVFKLLVEILWLGPFSNVIYYYERNMSSDVNRNFFGVCEKH